MALRAQGGALLYPVAIAFLGLGAGLQERAPRSFGAIMIFVVLLAIGRLALVRGFDRIYDRRPRLWQAGFLGGLLANCAVLSGLLYALITQHGLTALSMLGLTMAVGLAAMVIVVYPQFLGVVWSCILLLGVPAVTALQGLERLPRKSWIVGLCVAACLYLLWVAWQQHGERWAGLTARQQLALRASELERAQIELRQTRDELERVVAERTQALKRTNEDYRRIFENAHDAIIIFRPEDEQVLNVNRRACEIYGFTREEFLRISLASISENVARGQQQIRETLAHGVYYNFESTQFRKDGSPMFLEINASAIEYEGMRAILSVNRDVTERRKAEALRLAKEAAERAARAKTQFLVNMSHEIRTPMAGVIGLSDLLLATDLGPRQHEYARLIQSSAVSLLRVIDDILDFSKIEAGKLSFEDVPFDLRSLLREVVELLRLGAVAKGTSLALHGIESLPDWVRGDPGRLRQVLINLVGNAVKFTEGGTVNVYAETKAGGRFHLRVEDTGIGIPLDAQEKLFELFSQGDETTSRRFGGTGLGLAISKRIVEAMEGEIGFESTPGQGSTFWITVDLRRTTAPDIESVAPTGRPERSLRILTAEDNPINQLVITEHLKSFGHEVTAVNNGLQALEAIQTGIFDVVLMDCQMPYLDGYEATRLIRQIPGPARHVPIIALTAHAHQEELEKCREAGMNDVVTKPFRGEVLQSMLARWLGADPAAEHGGSDPQPAEDRTLDQRQLDTLCALARDSASGPSFLPKLLEKFRTTPYMEDLRGALARGDSATLKARAHALKGTSLFLGADRLQRLCARLELTCTDAMPEDSRTQVDLIEAELDNVVRTIEAAIASASTVGG